jgi:hypothetical protein
MADLAILEHTSAPGESLCLFEHELPLSLLLKLILVGSEKDI